jgi:hypothetical protein
MTTWGETTKLTPSLARTWNARLERGVQRNSLKPGQIDPALVFYGISRAGLHLWGTGKSQGVAEQR